MHFRISTHVRCGRILAAISHLKVLLAKPLNTCAGNVVSAMSAPQRDGIRGAVFCLNLFLFPYLCMYSTEEHPKQTRANCEFASNTAARGHLERFPPFCGHLVAVCTQGRRCWELTNQLCRAFQSSAFCQRFVRVFLHASLFVVRTYNLSWQCPKMERKCAKS